MKVETQETTIVERALTLTLNEVEAKWLGMVLYTREPSGFLSHDMPDWARPARRGGCVGDPSYTDEYYAIKAEREQ